AAGLKQPNLLNPAHAWLLKGPLMAYAKWYLSERLRPRKRVRLTAMPGPLVSHAEFAMEQLQKSALEISGTMRKHQLKLADRQCRRSELSARVQQMVVMLCTSLYAASQEDEVVRDAADCICRDLKRSLLGQRPSDDDFRQ